MPPNQNKTAFILFYKFILLYVKGIFKNYMWLFH